MPEKTNASQVSKQKTASPQVREKSQKSKPKWISISEIETSSPPEFQFRESNDEDTIDRYTEPLLFDDQGNKCEDKKHWPFPPIVVYLKDGKYIVLSGMHRLQAAIKAGYEKVPALILQKTEKEAIWFGLGANRQNGLPLQGDDLKHCIKMALEIGDRSHRVIASHLGCSASYVDKIAKQLPTSVQLSEKRTGKDGKQYPARKVARKKPAPDESEATQELVTVPKKIDSQSGRGEENQGNETKQPVNESESLQSRFLKLFKENPSSATGIEIYKWICSALNPSDKKAFAQLSFEFSTKILRMEVKKRSKHPKDNQGDKNGQS